MVNSIVVDDSDEDAARELDMQDASRDMLSIYSVIGQCWQNCYPQIQSCNRGRN